MKTAFLFLAKFIVTAPLCLCLWWGVSSYFAGLMGPYAWLVGQTAGILLDGLFHAQIQALDVITDGVYNSRSNLIFTLPNDFTRTLPIEPLVTNLPSYIALVLATGGLGWKRMAGIALLGSLILAVTHVLFIVLVFQYGHFLEEWRQIPEMLVMLPFLLWILLAYWDKLRLYLASADENLPAGEDERG